MNTQLATPFSMLVAASSKSGKTKLVKDLIINHYLMFDKPLVEIVWLYHKNAHDPEFFADLASKINVPIKFIQGFPSEDISNNSIFNSGKETMKCLILDDVVVTALKSPVFIDLFTVYSHHQSVCVIAILQNLHADTASQRQIMNNIIRNLSYLVLFADRRQMNGCKQIARTYFSGEEHKLIEPFKNLIDSKIRHQYMLVDFVNDEMPVRFNCLRPDEEMYVFL